MVSQKPCGGTNVHPSNPICALDVDFVEYGIEYATMPTACMTSPETILEATWPSSHSSGTDHCRPSGSQLCSAVPPLGLAGGRTLP